MIRNLLIAVAGAAICTTILGNVAHATTPPFTLTQLELKAGKVIGTGTATKAGAAISIQPFGKTVTTTAAKTFKFNFIPLPAQLASCTATFKLGLTSQTLSITGCGPKGATGAAGPKGPAGPKGATGATGAQGPMGATGAAGAQGPKGDAGPQGPKGDTGAQGPKGDNAKIRLVSLSDPYIIYDIGVPTSSYLMFRYNSEITLTAKSDVAVILTESLTSSTASKINFDVCYRNRADDIVKNANSVNSLTAGTSTTTKLVYTAHALLTLDPGLYTFGFCAKSYLANTKITSDYAYGTATIVEQ